ncbi:MAG TPA: pentapeptide repeat-containing protein, partial [Isosphaeraceae bacterium]|nr:pentapeptide repeat-containing protein [Isosphaeraceae bacterium]
VDLVIAPADVEHPAAGGETMDLLQIEGKLSLAQKRDGDEILSRFKSVTELLGDEADFRGANLGGANLGGANLTGAFLGGADLGGANLTGANLTGANLTGANLDGANLGGANLTGANLLEADLSGANLLGADLSGVIGLTPDQIRCARIDPSTKLPDSRNPPQATPLQRQW